MSERSRGTTASPSSIAWVHLAIAFLLELVMWGGLTYWGWQLGGDGLGRFLLAGLFLLLSTTLWGVFRAVGDTPSGRPPVVAIPGWARLILEVTLFALASVGIWTSVSRAAAETFMTVVVLHYAVTGNRVARLVRGS